MLGKLFDALFGCWHSEYSFPMTVRAGERRNKAASITGTYVVCLNCGKEFAYDWQEMKVVDSSDQVGRPMSALVTKVS